MRDGTYDNQENTSECRLLDLLEPLLDSLGALVLMATRYVDLYEIFPNNVAKGGEGGDWL